MFKLISWLRQLLNSPKRVGWLCLISLFLVLVIDGSLIRLWSLYNFDSQIESELKGYHLGMEELQNKLEVVSQPDFAERHARDHFDLVKKGEIVFLFAE